MEEHCDQCGRASTLLRQVGDQLLCTWCAPYRDHGEEIEAVLAQHREEKELR